MPPDKGEKPEFEAIRVVARVRPLLKKENVNRADVAIRKTSDTVLSAGRGKKFRFAHVFAGGASQIDVYNATVVDLVKHFLLGYNGTVMAYGQTGSGKTFTMGPAPGESVDAAAAGLLPRAVLQIFEEIDRISATHRCVVTIQCVEIYMDTVVDLLSPAESGLQIRELASGETVLLGATEVTARSPDEAFHHLTAAVDARRVGSTTANDRSSRSHAIFRVSMEKTPKSDASETDAPVDSPTFSVLQFVDLAGSERTNTADGGKSGVGTQMKEAIHINGGLLALGNVVSALADKKQRKKHVPYRNSKLTRMLKSSLGGNSKTVMVLCVSPIDDALSESLNTLKYGTRAMSIQNAPRINTNPHHDEIRRMQLEIERLQAHIHSAASTNPTDQDAADLKELTKCIAPAVRGLSTFLPPLAAQRLAEILDRRGIAVQSDDEGSPVVDQSWEQSTAFGPPSGDVHLGIPTSKNRKSPLSRTWSAPRPDPEPPSTVDVLQEGKSAIDKLRMEVLKLRGQLTAAHRSLEEDEAIFAAKVAEITALRGELQRVASPGTAPSSKVDWQPAFTLGVSRVGEVDSVAIPETNAERSRTPQVDVSLVGQLGLDTSLFAHADADIDDDVVLFDTNRIGEHSRGQQPRPAEFSVPDTAKRDNPEVLVGSVESLDAKVQAAIAGQIDETRALSEQQKINSLQVQCWDLGVLRDSLHLQKLRESQVLARGHGLSAAAGGEPHWTNDGIVEVTSAEQEVRLSALDLRLEAVIDGLQSAEAEIQFRENKLATLSHLSSGTVEQEIATAVDALATASSNGPRGRVATALKRYALQVVQLRATESRLCSRLEQEAEERETRMKTISELEQAVTRIFNEKESAVSVLSAENAALRSELQRLKTTPVPDEGAQARIDELSKSLYYYKKRSRELRRMLEAKERNQQTERAERASVSAGGAENHRIAEGDDDRLCTAPPRVAIPQPPQVPHPLNVAELDSPDRPKPQRQHIAGKDNRKNSPPTVDVYTLAAPPVRLREVDKMAATDEIRGRRRTYTIHD